MVKPCIPTEIAFYESISAHPELLPFIPKYIGRLSLGDESSHTPGALILPPETKPKEPKHVKTASVPVVNHAWKSSGGGKIETEQALVLENVASGFVKPDILDVKLGARLWADDAPPEKRARLDKVSSETTSKPLGFRIAGMKVFHGPGPAESQGLHTDGYKIFDKDYGRTQTVDTVDQGFKEFFRLEPNVKMTSQIRKVIKRFIGDLEGLVSVLETEESRMYSASLLFVYEGDASALEQSFIREAEMIEAYQSKEDEAAKPKATTNGKLETSGDAQSDGSGSRSEDSDSEAGQPKFPAIQNLRLIDFAHAQWTAGQGSDQNLLHGVRSVISVLKGLL